MASTDVQDMSGQVAKLMEQRLKLGGTGLSAKLRRGKRLLPRKVRKAAEHLAQMEGMAAHPKGARMLDLEAAERSYQTCMAYLRPLGSRERMVDGLLGMAASMALIVLVVGGGVVTLLVWRGYL